VLLKARGKCTTDHISQAGPWAASRSPRQHLGQHVPRAINAFADEPGHGVDVETGDKKPLPELARSYKQRGIRWIAVGDENYGEGSSREHAAMEPRHLGGVP